jgi:hypothetical protein
MIGPILGRTDPSGDPLQLPRLRVWSHSVGDLDINPDQVRQPEAFQATPNDPVELLRAQGAPGRRCGAEGITVPLHLHDVIPLQRRVFI